MKAEGVTAGDPSRLAVFVVPLGAAKARAVTLTAELRAAGIPADLAYGGRGLKGAMRAADRSGARYAVVLGERDLEGGTAQLKDLASGEQLTVALTDLATTIQEKLP
jgi:histidyl-tRNA synthetase